MQHVVPANIGDEGDLGTEHGDIREVLIRAHAHVSPASKPGVFECAHHLQVPRLVGDQIVGVEEAALLRHPLHEPGKGRIIDRLERALDDVGVGGGARVAACRHRGPQEQSRAQPSAARPCEEQCLHRSSAYPSAAQAHPGPQDAGPTGPESRVVNGTGALISRSTGDSGRVSAASSPAHSQSSPQFRTSSLMRCRTSTVRPFSGQRYSYRGISFDSENSAHGRTPTSGMGVKRARSSLIWRAGVGTVRST